MVISRTPVRISFFGGGTDYPVYFRTHGGETLVTAIDKFLTVSVHRLTQFFDHAIQVHYSKVESVKSLDEIQLPAARETLRYLGIESGVELHLAADLPSRTGIGSSSATTVGLLTALHAYRGRMVDEETIAAQAVHIEQEMIGERVGCQDQYACALGGFQHLRFHTDGSVASRPVTIRPDRTDELSDSLMLFYTSVQRTAHEVVKAQLDSTREGRLDRHLERMREQVGTAVSILNGGVPLVEFGRLMDEGWRLKRELSKDISNPWIDELYSAARAAGADGGKILGAGGGGFLLLFADPSRQAAVRASLSGLREVRFRFERQGTRVTFYRAD